MIYGRIPREINLDLLVSSIDGNITKREHIRNGIIYMISRIHNEQLKSKDDNFVILNHKTLERIIGKGEGDRVGRIKKILLENGIIEVDGKYQSRLKSLGYKMKQDYLTEDLIRIPYGERISKSISEILPDKEEETDESIEIDSTTQYPYLNLQFEKHNITWNNQLYNDIRSIGVEILESFERKRSSKNPSIISLLNYIGYLLIKVRDIEYKNYQYGVSISNNRYNSVVTSLPKSLRSYLLINGEQLVDVDIVTSQPYLLSCILNDRFENEEELGFNIKSLYPILKSYFEISNHLIQGVGLNNHKLFGCNFYEDEITSINEFCSLDFTQDFYQRVVGYGLQNNVQLTREQVKKSIMNFVFNDTIKHRDNSLVIIILEFRFKGLMSFFVGFHSKYSSRRLALLLQRVESHLMLDNVVPKILDSNENIPVFTIHDCVLTTTQYERDVSKIMKETIYSITDKPLEVKSNILHPNKENLKKQIQENTTVYKRSKSERVLIRKLKSNVLRGYHFLFPEGDEEINRIINQRFNQ
jgi:hypothetical protein